MLSRREIAFLDQRKGPKNVEGKYQKIQAKKKLGQKLSQKLQQISTKSRYKIQNNYACAASGARPNFFFNLIRYRLLVMHAVR